MGRKKKEFEGTTYRLSEEELEAYKALPRPVNARDIRITAKKTYKTDNSLRGIKQ